MPESENVEKRQRQRLLCSDHFSATRIVMGSQAFSAQSINFNYRGIGLFSMARLPEMTQCQLDFAYGNPDQSITIHNLIAELVYANETEVGNQYGFRFSEASLSSEIKHQLEQIEQCLVHDTKHHRYGF